MERRGWTAVRLLVVVVWSLSIGPRAWAGATIYVSQCGNNNWAGLNPNCTPPTGPKRTIQAAIDVAGDGDQIIVFGGVYHETIDLKGKAIHLRSASGPDVTSIDGNGSGPVVTCHGSEGPDTIVEGFTIRNGSNSGGSGGGMSIVLGSPTVTNCIFLNNTSTVNGGGLFGLGCDAEIIGCTFLGNQAENGGGVYLFGGDATIENCAFVGNVASAIGGGLACLNGSGATIVTSSFDQNEAGAGGGLYVDESASAVTFCSFDGNGAGFGGGGGMANGGGSEAEISACFFTNNFSGNDGGGGMNNDGSSPTIEDSLFQGNTHLVYEYPDTGGGAMRNVDGSPHITECEFEANHAFAGGAILNQAGGHPQVSDSTFTMNTATLGGGVWNFESAVTLNSCDFVFNETVPYQTFIQFGGAVGGMDASEFTGVSCSFDSNASEYGGAVLVYSASAVYVNCSFRNNAASAGGGAIHCGVAANARFVNARVVENTAPPGMGGAVHLDDAAHDVVFVNGTIAGNLGGGAIANVAPDGLVLRNSIVWGNAGGTFFGVPPEEVTYSNVEGGFAGAGNLEADPRFEDEALMSYAVLPCSPCIDAGSNTAVPADELDLDGDGDAAEPLPYDGSNHARFVDHLSTVDTGLPGPPGPIVDMGALEFQTNAATAAVLTGCEGTFGSDPENDGCDPVNLADNDDAVERLRSRPGFLASEPNVAEIRIDGVAANATSLATIRVRDNSVFGLNTVVTVKARNHARGGLEEVGSYQPTNAGGGGNDTLHEIVVGSCEHLGAQGEFEVRLRYVSPAVLVATGFDVWLDQVEVTVE